VKKGNVLALFQNMSGRTPFPWNNRQLKLWQMQGVWCTFKELGSEMFPCEHWG